MTVNLGTLRGVPAYTAGKFDNALSGGVLGLSATSAWNSTVGTAECWVKTTNSSGAKVAVGSDGSGSGASSLWIGTNNGNAAFGTNDGFGTQSSSIPITDGNWHHLAVTVDGTNHKLWVDGTLAVTHASTYPFSWNGNSVTNTTTIAIGGFGSQTSFDWIGYTDDVRISNVVRYTASFTPPISAFVGADGQTTALYHLDTDGSDSSAVGAPTGSTSSRILTEYVEAVSNTVPARRLDSLYVEAASAGTPNRQLDTLYIEAASAGTPKRQLDTVYLEVITPRALASVSFKYYQSGAWTLYRGVPKVYENGSWLIKQGTYWNGSSWVNLPS